MKSLQVRLKEFEYHEKGQYFLSLISESENNILYRFIHSMHSILGWASFCMNYCINAAWYGVDQSVALLRCNEDQVALIAAFRSSALLGLVSLIFLLTIHHRFSMEFRSGEFAGQSSTVTP